MSNYRLFWLSCSFVLLAGCGNGAESPAPAPAATAASKPIAAVKKANTGVIETSAGRYVFTPNGCRAHDVDGFPDLEASGPGTAPDGEKIFVELSTVGNRVVIELGVDRPMQSSDRRLQAGEGVTDKLDIQVSDNAVRIASLTLLDDDGKRITGSLQMDCP